MNKPDKAGEPSIEEILASIRRKSSEGPAASQSAGGEPPVAPADKPFGASAPPPPGEAPPALLDRLNGMTRGDATAGGEAQAAASNGAKRPMSFDQDLADMFDEPAPAAASPAAPKPEMRVAPDLGSFTAQPPPAVETASAPPVAAEPPAFDAPSPRVAPAPFGAGFGTADGAAQAPKPPAYGFPPLTKRGGFYPRSEPQLPPMPATGAGDAAASPASSSSSTHQDSGAPAVSGDSARISDLGSLVPAAATGRGVHTPRSSFGSPPLGGSGTDTLSRDPLVPNGEGLNGASMNGAGRVLPELDAKSPSAPPSSAPPAGFATPSLKMPSAGLKPEAASMSSPTSAMPGSPRANGGLSPSANPFAASPALERAPVPDAPKPLVADKDLSLASTSETAATQALDALALGLAASQTKPEPRLAAPSLRVPSPDAPSQAPVKPVSEGGAVEAPAPAAVSAAPAPASAARSFEDVVSDMLRPMLQKWVQENMPRIMEKALRSEMQRTLGPGGKPPGSAS